MIEQRARIFHSASSICYDRLPPEVIENDECDVEALDHALYTYGVVLDKIDPYCRYWPES